MKTAIIFSAIFALLIGLAGGITYTQKQATPPQPAANNTAAETLAVEDYLSIRPALSSFPTDPLTDAEKSDLLYMREEEKLARDVYQTLYEKWSMQIFANIAQSEQTHTETVRDLLEKYSLTDPVNTDTVGVFQNQELQSLYTNLVKQGNVSEVEALKVGALIEDLDIKDLKASLARTDNADITFAYENLTRASRNHLRSFTKQLTTYGETYTPQHITAEEYTAIVTSATERGSGNGEEQGRGEQ